MTQKIIYLITVLSTAIHSSSFASDNPIAEYSTFRTNCAVSDQLLELTRRVQASDPQAMFDLALMQLDGSGNPDPTACAYAHELLESAGTKGHEPSIALLSKLSGPINKEERVDTEIATNPASLLKVGLIGDDGREAPLIPLDEKAIAMRELASECMRRGETIEYIKFKKDDTWLDNLLRHFNPDISGKKFHFIITNVYGLLAQYLIQRDKEELILFPFDDFKDVIQYLFLNWQSGDDLDALIQLMEEIRGLYLSDARNIDKNQTLIMIQFFADLADIAKAVFPTEHFAYQLQQCFVYGTILPHTIDFDEEKNVISPMVDLTPPQRRLAVYIAQRIKGFFFIVEKEYKEYAGVFTLEKIINRIGEIFTRRDLDPILRMVLLDNMLYKFLNEQGAKINNANTQKKVNKILAEFEKALKKFLPSADTVIKPQHRPIIWANAICKLRELGQHKANGLARMEGIDRFGYVLAYNPKASADTLNYEYEKNGFFAESFVEVGDAKHAANFLRNMIGLLSLEEEERFREEKLKRLVAIVPLLQQYAKIDSSLVINHLALYAATRKYPESAPLFALLMTEETPRTAAALDKIIDNIVTLPQLNNEARYKNDVQTNLSMQRCCFKDKPKNVRLAIGSVLSFLRDCGVDVLMDFYISDNEEKYLEVRLLRTAAQEVVSNPLKNKKAQNKPKARGSALHKLDEIREKMANIDHSKAEADEAEADEDDKSLLTPTVTDLAPSKPDVCPVDEGDDIEETEISKESTISICIKKAALIAKEAKRIALERTVSARLPEMFRVYYRTVAKEGYTKKEISRKLQSQMTELIEDEIRTLDLILDINDQVITYCQIKKLIESLGGEIRIIDSSPLNDGIPRLEIFVELSDRMAYIGRSDAISESSIIEKPRLKDIQMLLIHHAINTANNCALPQSIPEISTPAVLSAAPSSDASAAAALPKRKAEGEPNKVGESTSPPLPTNNAKKNGKGKGKSKDKEVIKPVESGNPSVETGSSTPVSQEVRELEELEEVSSKLQFVFNPNAAEFFPRD